MRDVLLFGPPGCGKGTQAALMTGFRHISTGNMFRDAVANGTELGKKVAPLLGIGTLIPDELTMQLIEEQCDIDQDTVWDGFPRTLFQARAFDTILERYNRRVSVLINLSVPEDVLLTRVLGRFEKSGRADDNASSFAIRLKTYYEQTKPVLDHYFNSTVVIDGTLPVETISKRIAILLDE